MTRPKILLAVPAYNCAPQIGRVLDALEGPLLGRLASVVVIDNGSTDGTVEVALSHGARFGDQFQVWRNLENYGLGGTHKVAFSHGIAEDYDYVAILHGDDQASAAELERLIQVAERRPTAAAVLGSRFMNGSTLDGYSKIRTWGNRAINTLFSAVSLRRTTDIGSGLNLFKMAPLADRGFVEFDDRITFNIDLLLHYYSKKAKLVHVPITWSERDQVSNARNLSVGRTAVEKLLRWRTGRSRYARAHVLYPFEVVA